MKSPPSGLLWRQVADQLLELANGFDLIATVDPLLELIGVEPTFSVVAAQALAGGFPIGIGGA